VAPHLMVLISRKQLPTKQILLVSQLMLKVLVGLWGNTDYSSMLNIILFSMVLISNSI
jgi:hypothetical protein